jgi:putative oxidoreductase
MKNHPLLRKILNLLARIFLGAVFLMTAAGHLVPEFNKVVESMDARGVPLPQAMLAGAVVVLLAGSLSIIIGFFARIGAALLFVFLGMASYFIHPFWLESDVHLRENEMIHFLKNIALMGAMLLMMAHGSGPLSVDSWRGRRSGQPRPPRVL